MQTGSLSNGQCFETTAAAVDDYFSKMTPYSYSSGGFVFTDSFKYINGIWYEETWASSVGAAGSFLNSSVVAPIPTFPPCDAPSSYFNDGVLVGASMLAVIVIAWAFSAAHKAIWV